MLDPAKRDGAERSSEWTGDRPEPGGPYADLRNERRAHRSAAAWSWPRLAGAHPPHPQVLDGLGVILTPVRYLALLPGNMVATVLVQLEGHAGHPGAGERSYCYSGSTCSATGRIRAITPQSATPLQIVCGKLCDRPLGASGTTEISA